MPYGTGPILLRGVRDTIEQMLLGLVAYRVGKKIEYDSVAGHVTNSPEANALLKRTYRPGWTLNG